MEDVFLIKYCEEELGKPSSSFTLDDWRRVAIFADRMIENLENQLHPPAKKRGRPQKIENAFKLPPDELFRRLYPKQPRQPGRRRQKYYGRYDAKSLTEIVDDLMNDPTAPRSQREIVRKLMNILQKRTGAGCHSVETIERTIRRERKRTKLKK